MSAQKVCFPLTSCGEVVWKVQQWFPDKELPTERSSLGLLSGLSEGATIMPPVQATFMP